MTFNKARELASAFTLGVGAGSHAGETERMPEQLTSDEKKGLRLTIAYQLTGHPESQGFMSTGKEREEAYLAGWQEAHLEAWPDTVNTLVGVPTAHSTPLVQWELDLLAEAGAEDYASADAARQAELVAWARSHLGLPPEATPRSSPHGEL